MIDFHRRFERFISVPDRFEGSMLRLFSMRKETGIPGMEQHVFYHAVYSHEEAVLAVPFVLIEGPGAVFPWALRSLSGDILSRIRRDFNEFAATVKDERAAVRIFGSDADLTWFADHAGDAPLLGLSTYEQFFSAMEPYEALVARAGGRRVLDACARLGDGAILLGAFATHVDAVTADQRMLRTARRMGRRFLRDTFPPGPWDLVVRTGVDATTVAAAVQDAGNRAHAAGILTAAGEEGRRALESIGPVRAMPRPGYEAMESKGNWEVTLGGSDTLTSRETSTIPQVTAPAAVSANPLAVLMVLRPSAAGVFGGDVVQVQRTAEALRRRGHRVEVSTDKVPATEHFDIVHVTNLTATLETLAQVRSVRSFRGPIALMPIFLDHADETIWGMPTHTACFIASTGEVQLEEFLAHLARRQLTASSQPHPPARVEPFDGYTAHQREIVASCDFLVANALAEVHRIYRYLDCTIPFAIAPSATDASLYSADARQTFIAEYGIQDFVLCTGRIEPRKNQLLLMRALRDSPVRLVLVGRNEVPHYGALVRAFRSRNTMIIPHLSERDLAGAYAAARVVAMPSWNEVVSLSSLNGAVCEASLVLSRNSYEHEYFRDDAEYCDPGHVDSIRSAIERAWDSHDVRAERRRSLAMRIRADYTWDRSAEETERAYRRFLKSNPRGERRLRTAAAAS